MFYIVLISFLGQYIQHQCNTSEMLCVPCLERLPSCIGLQDGDNAIPGKWWMEGYMHCYKNRTIAVQNCSYGYYFHPRKRQCLEVLEKGNILF